MRLTVILATALIAASGAFLFADSSANANLAPYPAPDFTVNMPDGKPLRLSSLRGKVVVCEFLYTTCPHCQHASQVFTDLYKEFGARGFQPVGIAFNEDLFAKGASPVSAVTDFVQKFNVGYRIGWSDREKVIEFLGISPFERFVVPQIVWIDRKGMIRAKTLPGGEDQQHYQEAYWREMIESLTKEPAGSARSAQHPLHTARK